MTALLLVAIAAAITAVAALIARRRRRRREDVYEGRHTKEFVLKQIAKAAEQDDLMTYSREIRTRVVAAQKAVEQLTGKAVA